MNISAATGAEGRVTTHLGTAQMDNPVFGVPRSFRFAAGPAHLDDGEGSGGAGGGSSGDGSTGSSEDGDSSSQNLPSHLQPARLMQEHGDARQALGALSQKVETLESERKQQREQVRDLKDQVPDDQAVVVDPDTIEELREQGFLDSDDPTADDLIQALQEEREQRVTLQNKQRFEEVVSVTGANRDVLKDIGADTLTYEVEEETDDDGNTMETAYVKTDDGRVEFTQYVKNEYPTLADTILDGSGSTSSESTSQSYPSQPGSGSGGGGSNDDEPVTDTDAYIEKLNEQRGRGDDG